MTLWLNKNTLEEKYLESGSVIKGIGWVKVPDGATFATGDKDNFVFRKDGWYYDNQTGWWVKGDVNLQELYKHEFVKLFWVKSDVKESVFTLERLLGCEVLIYNETFYIDQVFLDSLEKLSRALVFEVNQYLSKLTFFTEDGDELTFDDYVNKYYGE